MNVWLRKARKLATCTYEGCKDKAIENGTYYVVCQWYMNTKGGLHWRKQMIFHPQCWIDRAIAEIEKRVVVETRGRKKMTISDSHREIRLKIMRRRAAVVQRIKMATESYNYPLIERLVGKLEKYKEQIEPYGGAPEKW